MFDIRIGGIANKSSDACLVFVDFIERLQRLIGKRPVLTKPFGAFQLEIVRAKAQVVANTGWCFRQQR